MEYNKVSNCGQMCVFSKMHHIQFEAISKNAQHSRQTAEWVITRYQKCSIRIGGKALLLHMQMATANELSLGFFDVRSKQRVNAKLQVSQRWEWQWCLESGVLLKCKPWHSGRRLVYCSFYLQNFHIWRIITICVQFLYPTSPHLLQKPACTCKYKSALTSKIVFMISSRHGIWERNGL